MPYTRGARDAATDQPPVLPKTLTVTVGVDTDELREWAGKHADAGQHGVAHVLYATATQLETGEVPAFLNGGTTPPPASSPDGQSRPACRLEDVRTVSPLRVLPDDHVAVPKRMAEIARQRTRAWDRDLGYPGSSVDDADLIRELAALLDGEVPA